MAQTLDKNLKTKSVYIISITTV